MGGGQKFLLNRLQAVGTHNAAHARYAGVGSNPGSVIFAAAAGGGATVARPGFEPPTARMPAGCITTRPLCALQRRASLLLWAASATDKKPKLCVSV